MAYVITDECIACGSCEDTCPLEAISEGEDKYVIDPKLCNDCGTCADQCPVEAIVPGDDK
jgi:NAD-dependent dihydropyrimidine dehydrogenase PreA subunit